MRTYIVITLVIFLIGGMLVFRNADDSAQKDVRSAHTSCSSEKSRSSYYGCVKNHLSKGVQEKGVRVYLDALEDILVKKTTDIGSYYGCHDMAHIMGQIAGASDYDLNATIGECNHLCSSGCYHGVMEGYVSRHGEMASKISDLCQKSSGVTKDLWTKACFHGVGHGLASFAGDIHEVINLCDKIPGDYGKQRCYSGAFMELYAEGTMGHQASLPIPEDMIGFCNDLKNPYQSMCLALSGEKVLLRTNDIHAAMATCAGLTKEVQQDCYVGLGEAMYFAFRENRDDLAQMCLEAKTHLGHCILGVIVGIVESDPQGKEGEKLCSAVENPEMKDLCLHNLAENIRAASLADKQR